MARSRNATAVEIIRPRSLCEVDAFDCTELDWLESLHDDLSAVADAIEAAGPLERAQMRRCIDAWWLRLQEVL